MESLTTVRFWEDAALGLDFTWGVEGDSDSESESESSSQPISSSSAAVWAPVNKSLSMRQ